MTVRKISKSSLLALVLSSLLLLVACEDREDAAQQLSKEADARIAKMDEINKNLRTNYGIALINEKYLDNSIHSVSAVDDPEQLAQVEEQISLFIDMGREVQAIDDREDVEVMARPQVDRAIKMSEKVLGHVQFKKRQILALHQEDNSSEITN